MKKYILVAFIIFGCAFQENKNNRIRFYIENAFMVVDSTGVPSLELKRDLFGRDTLIIRDSMKAIKYLMINLKRCMDENKIHDTVYLDRS